jgi:hypothetical protein
MLGVTSTSGCRTCSCLRSSSRKAERSAAGSGCPPPVLPKPGRSTATARTRPVCPSACSVPVCCQVAALKAWPCSRTTVGPLPAVERMEHSRSQA